MKIIAPSAILTTTGILSDQAVAFDTVIEAIAPLDELKARYPEADVTMSDTPTLLMPGLVNPHVHLEFSANRTTLEYGEFMPWLYSVIEHRETLMEECGSECMHQAIHTMLQNGITAFGAISSRGLDLDPAASSPQKVVFFNELIGSQMAMADALYADFIERCEASLRITRSGFYTGVAVHSPYSVHPILIQKALQYAKSHHLCTSAHYLESSAERQWLEHSSGALKPFFKEFLKQDQSMTDPKEFLNFFEGTNTLLTHVVHATDEELNQIKRAGHTIVHCPVSNRLLGNGAIDLSAINQHNLPWVIGTDGLSSNYRLDLFEEMKIALFLHADTPLLAHAIQLLNAATEGAAKALGLNCGTLEKGKAADLLWLELDHTPNEQTPIHLLLHHYPIRDIYIDGTLQKKD